MDSTAADLESLDRIDKSIDIDATAEQVWSLVSRPGWWINEGVIDPDPDLQQLDGDLTLVRHRQYGEFRLRTVASQRPSYVAFRWLEQDAPAGEEPSTLLEFRIEPHRGGVRLKVAESGFATLGKENRAVVQQVQENTEGWETELVAAQSYLESRG